METNQDIEIRKADPSDLDTIMAIYRTAQDFMIHTGNPTQWGRFYPTEPLLKTDIAEGKCFVVTAQENVHAVFVLCFGEEPTYRVIENGAWPNDAPYVTIHRIASDGQIRNVFKAAVDYCASLSGHIRVDTHENNLVMRKLIERNGFIKCGIIRVANGTPRIAYQLDVDE